MNSIDPFDSVQTSVATNKFNEDDPRYIIAYKDFLELLQYERIRCDRTGEAFSLLVFEGTKSLRDEVELRMITQLIKPYLREIDHIGWYGSQSLAVIMPLTDSVEADGIEMRIKRQLKDKGVSYPTVCHTYPTNWFSRKKDEGDLTYTPWQKDKQFNEVGRKVARKMPFWKRSFDLITSSLILLTISPLLIVTAIYIKIVSPGPVFYVSERVGHKGRTFKFLKFRSMHISNNEALHGKHAQSFIKDGNVPMVKLDDAADPRIIRGGGFLRSSCIDELPQLINVVKGDMSLVGPRPCIPYEAEEYLRWHTHRFDSVPGMTGLWQVSGKNDLTFKEMVRLDITYSRNLSLFNDVKIMFRTIPTVLKLLGHYYGKFKNKVEKKITPEDRDYDEALVAKS
ncbi:MAG: sugar transferase [Spirochaetales bacterium]|nr:sugar transferase [Spirochaetales bacterium]